MANVQRLQQCKCMDASDRVSNRQSGSHPRLHAITSHHPCLKSACYINIKRIYSAVDLDHHTPQRRHLRRACPAVACNLPANLTCFRSCHCLSYGHRLRSRVGCVRHKPRGSPRTRAPHLSPPTNNMSDRSWPPPLPFAWPHTRATRPTVLLPLRHIELRYTSTRRSSTFHTSADPLRGPRLLPCHPSYHRRASHANTPPTQHPRPHPKL